MGWIMPIRNNTDTRIRTNVIPVRVYAQGDCPCANSFLRDGELYASLYPQEDMPVFRGRGFLLFDFGKEMCGGIRIVYHRSPRPAKIRIRFGESVGECCAELGHKNAGNEHSVRDFEVTLPNFSDSVYGDTGFRFVRLDFSEDTEYMFYGVRAVSTHWEAVREGAFVCEDALVNRIYDTAAYTCGLCVQTQLWDGIKRDRLVWIGDLHPEAKALYCLYRDVSPIRDALDFAQSLSERAGLRWVNGIPSYSFWWLINLCDYVEVTQDKEYLREKLAFAGDILSKLDVCVDSEGRFDPGNEDMAYFISTDGTNGLSCFMSYYILKAGRFPSTRQEGYTRRFRPLLL